MQHSAWSDGRYRNTFWVAAPTPSDTVSIFGGDSSGNWAYHVKAQDPKTIVKGGARYGHLPAFGIYGCQAAWFTGLARWCEVDPEVRFMTRLVGGHPRLIAEQAVEGRMCAVVEFDTDSWQPGGTCRVWVCPNLGHAIVRREHSYTWPTQGHSESSHREQSTYTDFHEYLPGIWLPAKMAETAHVEQPDGSWALVSSVSRKALLLEANQPVPEEELLVPSEGAVVVTDEKWRPREDVGQAETPVEVAQEDVAEQSDDEASATEAEGQVIRLIRFEGLRGVTADQVLAKMKTKAGDAYDAADPQARLKLYERLARDLFEIEQLLASKGYAMLVPEFPRVSNDGVLTIRLSLSKKGTTTARGALVAVRGGSFHVATEDLPAVLEQLKESSLAAAPSSHKLSMRFYDLDTDHLMRLISRTAGGSVVLEEGAGGPITIEAYVEADMKVLLDVICGAKKGLHWWRHDTGAYIVSAMPKPGTSPTDATPEPAGEKIARMYHLEHMPATYIAYLYGYSDDPGPMRFRPDLGDVGSAPVPGGPGGGRGVGGGGAGGFGAGGGFIGAGAFADFLPEGIEAMIAFPVLNSLLIRGTEEDIDELIEILKFVDHKPQQVILEITCFSGLPASVDGSELITLAAGTGTDGVVLSAVPASWEDVEMPEDAEEGFGARVATMNLLPAVNALSDTVLLAITPRINGDGTITLHTEVRQSDRAMETPEDLEATSASGRTLAHTAVNVRDEETFGHVVYFDGSWHTIIVTPRIVRDTEDEN